MHPGNDRSMRTRAMHGSIGLWSYIRVVGLTTHPLATSFNSLFTLRSKVQGVSTYESKCRSKRGDDDKELTCRGFKRLN